MRSTNRKNLCWLPAICIPMVLVLSACGTSKADSTPTLSVEAIFTSAAETFSAQQATELALTPPTSTPEPTLFPTLPPPSPFATIDFTTPTASSGGVSTCDNAAYIADVTIPDGTIVDAGGKFVKTWLLQNTGTCEWNTSYKITFDSGTQMGGTDTFINIPVPVGTQAKVSVNLVGPSEAGSYYGKWQMQNDKGQSFGSLVTVVIKVGTSADTPTATP